MLGTCPDPRCTPLIPGLRIELQGDSLYASGFTLKALKDPMSEEPFDYPDGTYASVEDAAAGGATFYFDGKRLACGVKEVTCTLKLTADAAAGGAPARRVELTYAVELGPLLRCRGYDSWSGKKTVWIKLHVETQPDAAAVVAAT